MVKYRWLGEKKTPTADMKSPFHIGVRRKEYNTYSRTYRCPIRCVILT